MAEVTPAMEVEEHLPPVTPEESQLAKQAMSEFERNKLDACNATLSRLAQTRGADPKVIHNKAVVQYFKSSKRRTDEFRKSLEEVCAKMRMSVESAALIDDLDQCTVYYNYAVIMYRLQQHHRAIDILAKVFQFVDPMEKLTVRVVMLLIDLYLCTQQPEKAMSMITYAEKNLLNGKSSSTEKEGDKEQPPQKETKESKELEALRNKISHHKTRCSLMLKNLKVCKREVKALSNSLGNSVAMIYVKANLELLRGNWRKAIKVLNTNPQSQRPTDETGEHVPTMYYNNLGVIHFCMHKHNLGAFYFRKALHENTQIVNEFHKADLSKQLSGRLLQTLSVNRHHVLLYNMGVQLLHCGHPSAAFDCLIETMHLYHISPRLWLRLAECCIMAHRNGNEEDKKLANRLKVVHSSVGSGVHKKLVLGPGFKDDDRRRLHESADTPNTTLEFAALCLKNALCLLTMHATTAAEPPSPIRPSSDAVLAQAPPGNPMRPTEVENLRCSVLASSSYVALCLNDHVLALQYARTLLSQPRLSPAHRYLAQMYIAEAQVSLDHIADAIQQLNPEAISDVSPVFPELKQESDKSDKNGESEAGESKDEQTSTWYPRDVATARCVMQYNLATCHAIRGEYEKSLAHLKETMQAMGQPLPAQMTALHIYLELMEGRRTASQAIIKESFGHMSANRPGA